MATVFHNPYSGQTPIVWSLQTCIIIATPQTGGAVKDGILAAVQGVRIQFSRQLTKRYPLTTGSPITIVGVPKGTCQLTTIMGPKSQVTNFLSMFGSTCQPFTLTVGTNNSAVNPDPSCKTQANSPQSFIMKNCTGQAVTVDLSMQNNILVAQGVFNIQFGDLDWNNTAVKP